MSLSAEEDFEKIGEVYRLVIEFKKIIRSTSEGVDAFVAFTSTSSDNPTRDYEFEINKKFVAASEILKAKKKKEDRLEIKEDHFAKVPSSSDLETEEDFVQLTSPKTEFDGAQHAEVDNKGLFQTSWNVCGY